MGKKSIKIVIAGRNYPLTINENEEELIRNAVNDINTNVNRLQENYAVKDMQDLLAMTSLQLATRPNSRKKTSSEEKQQDEHSQKKILEALQLLSNSIEE